MNKKTNLTVEEKIQKNYQAEDGIWLVQKGKITEARLLKESYERIEYLKKVANHNADLYKNKIEERVVPYRDENKKLRQRINELETQLENQKRINRGLKYNYKEIRNAVAQIELLSNEID